TTRCPNPSCGHVSRLVDDPLGRIFRCSRCLTKLPTAPAAAADAGWTAGARPSPRARSRSAAASGAAPLGCGARSCGGGGGGGGGGEWGEVGGLGRGGERVDGLGSDPGYGPDESGEVLVAPMSQAGSRASAWSAASRSAAVSAPSVAIGSAEAGAFGR